MLIKFRIFIIQPVYTLGQQLPMAGLRKLDVIKISYQSIFTSSQRQEILISDS